MVPNRANVSLVASRTLPLSCASHMIELALPFFDMISSAFFNPASWEMSQIETETP